MTPCLRLLPAHEYRRLRWKNQLGWTREIHAEPRADAWRWRISIAELDGDAGFSTFPGVQRELVLLRGEGLRLRFDDGESVVLLPPHQRLRFDGARDVSGEPRGHCEVFNLMWRRDVATAQLWHRPLAGAMLSFVDPGSTWVVHVLGGHAHVDGGNAAASLGQGDTALLGSDGARSRYVIEGGGEVLLVRIDEVAD
ncbi:HutD family protein [Luteimonas composti]|uniref:HutD family protein n=1 Tax=Luteimonas composti TaxID=398257 RepID=A0ABT6MV12_9GAMM|nr:HutD family protein [Luteimonas composti]MDH7454091.1 HutD family protein [Luteimonas composti]